MSKWTPEPWTIGAGSHVCGMWSGMIRVESPEDFHSNGIEYPDGSTRSFTNVVCGTTGHSETARENMLRIVACVNAMAGIPDPAAYIENSHEAFRQAARLDAATAERDALRSQVADLTAQRDAAVNGLLAVAGFHAGGSTGRRIIDAALNASRTALALCQPSPGAQPSKGSP